MNLINYVTGDATQPEGTGTKIIAHIVNDIGLWGSGFVMAISKRWPDIKDQYVEWARGNESLFALGQVQYVDADNDIVIANMVAQRGVRNDYNPVPLSMYHLRWALMDVERVAYWSNATIHMPRIGAGLAGGNWEDIERLINNTITDVPVTIYDLV